MSITTELRKYADNFCGIIGETLTILADDIDANHERLMREQPYTIDMVPMTDENMAEHGWIRLPLDADGVPIRVGDVVTMQLLFGGESKPLVVDRMELSHGRDGDLWCIALDTDKECWNQPSLMRHYTPPTVDDVLREFADEVRRCCDTADTIAEYAAKLRLAEREDS